MARHALCLGLRSRAVGRRRPLGRSHQGLSNATSRQPSQTPRLPILRVVRTRSTPLLAAPRSQRDPAMGAERLEQIRDDYSDLEFSDLEFLGERKIFAQPIEDRPMNPKRSAAPRSTAKTQPVASKCEMPTGQSLVRHFLPGFRRHTLNHSCDTSICRHPQMGGHWWTPLSERLLLAELAGTVGSRRWFPLVPGSPLSRIRRR